MTGEDLKHARERKGWTQEQAARLLCMSQEYLSMLERGRRRLPASRLRTVLRKYGLSPLALPLHGENEWQHLDNKQIALQFAALGYPGFAHVKSKTRWNPQELLVAALTKADLERRVVEALPWLVLRYTDMDWEWVVRESKLHDAQNRLGFIVTLASQLAEQNNRSVLDRLRRIVGRLQNSLLAKTGTLCHESMSAAEKKWLQKESTPEAQQWNILSDLSPEHLVHAA